MEYAKKYYGCDDIEGVYLENQGGSGTARLDNKLIVIADLKYSMTSLLVHNFSSHWEKRTLNHEMMNGYISKYVHIHHMFKIAYLQDNFYPFRNLGIIW